MVYSYSIINICTSKEFKFIVFSTLVGGIIQVFYRRYLVNCLKFLKKNNTPNKSSAFRKRQMRRLLNLKRGAFLCKNHRYKYENGASFSKSICDKRNNCWPY